MRVVIGEDQALIREGMVLRLEREGFEVVGQAGDGEDLVRKANAHDPDVVVADIRMPPTQTDEGLHAALEIRGSRPNIAIVVLSHHVHRQYACELLESGAGAGGVGYLLKQRVADETASARICGGSAPVLWCSMRRWSLRCWDAPAATTRSTGSPLASATCSH